VRELAEAARRVHGAGALPPLRFVPGSGAATNGARSATASAAQGPVGPAGSHFVYLPYPKAFDDTALARDLADAGKPDPRDFLPRVFDFCRATDWGARLPWGDSPCARPAQD
jgi:hypothetical protein